MDIIKRVANSQTTRQSRPGQRTPPLVWGLARTHTYASEVACKAADAETGAKFNNQLNSACRWKFLYFLNIVFFEFRNWDYVLFMYVLWACFVGRLIAVMVR